MRQAYVPEIGKIAYRDVPVPRVGVSDVLIEVQSIGICGSDQHVFHGLHPLVQPPLVQGHEFSGRVEAIGDDVKTIDVGALVTVQPACGCGKCAFCRDGLPGQCADLNFVGGNIPGAMSDFIAVPEDQVFTFPDDVLVEDAAMAEPVAVAVRAVAMAGALGGSPVFIAGGGTIGQLVARVAMLAGAELVILSDPNANRRAVAELAGCRTIDPSAKGDFGTALAALRGSRCINTVFECVGTTPALTDCVAAVARRGLVVVCGVFAKPPVIDMTKVQDQELTIRGSLMYSWSDFSKAVELVAQGQIDLTPIQTHHVAFEKIIEAYDLLAQKDTKAIKVFVDVKRADEPV